MKGAWPERLAAARSSPPCGRCLTPPHKPETTKMWRDFLCCGPRSQSELHASSKRNIDKPIGAGK